MGYPYLDPDYLIDQTDYVRDEAAWGQHLPAQPITVGALESPKAVEALSAEVS